MGMTMVAAGNGGAGKIAGGKAAAAGESATAKSGASQAGGRETSVDIYQHMGQQRSPTDMLRAMPTDMQAKVLANPATLGKQLFGYLDGFQQRSQSMMSGAYMKGGTSLSGQTLPGPAERHPGATKASSVETSWDRADNFLETFREMYTFLAETQLVTAGTTQSSRSVTTLMRSQ